MSSFSLDQRGRPADTIGYMGHSVTIETPPPPNEFSRPKAQVPAIGGKKKRAYKYPEWRKRKRGR